MIHPLIRIFHWSLVLIVALNQFVTESGGDWHEWLGYLACAWIGVRLVLGPAVTHSGAALLVMVLMLSCVLLLGLSGWMLSWDRFFGEEWLEQAHELMSYALLGLIALHIAGVIRQSIKLKRNLVLAMIHGRKY